jgi:hypothetical protein
MPHCERVPPSREPIIPRGHLFRDHRQHRDGRRFRTPPRVSARQRRGLGRHSGYRRALGELGRKDWPLRRGLRRRFSSLPSIATDRERRSSSPPDPWGRVVCTQAGWGWGAITAMMESRAITALVTPITCDWDRAVPHSPRVRGTLPHRVWRGMHLPAMGERPPFHSRPFRSLEDGPDDAGTAGTPWASVTHEKASVGSPPTTAHRIYCNPALGHRPCLAGHGP